MRIFTWLAVLMVLVLGLWAWPQYQDIEVKEATVVSQETLKNGLITRLKELQAEKQAHYEQAALLQELDAKIPVGVSQEIFMQDLRNIIGSSGFSYDGIAFDQSVDEALNLATIKASFNVQGPKSTLLSLLGKIEKNPRFMQLENFNFNTETLNGVEIVNLNLVISGFSQMHNES